MSYEGGTWESIICRHRNTAPIMVCHNYGLAGGAHDSGILEQACQSMPPPPPHPPKRNDLAACRVIVMRCFAVPFKRGKNQSSIPSHEVFRAQTLRLGPPPRPAICSFRSSRAPILARPQTQSQHPKPESVDLSRGERTGNMY